MEELQLKHASEQWKLSFYLPKASTKALLVHNVKKFPSIPIAHAVHKTETCENLQVLLQTVRHEEHRWNIFFDIKVTAMLTELQGGYSKFYSYLCEWDSRERE
jgi:hypothetical protein